MEIYLDHASTTKIHPSVLKKMNDSYASCFANPSSVHGSGYLACQYIQQARESMKNLLNGRDYRLVFTSGGTESNNTAIMSLMDKQQLQQVHWVCSAIEHPSVLRPYEYLQHRGAAGEFADCHQLGRMNPERIANAVTKETKLVSLMHVNNETGIIQPVQETVKLVKEKNPGVKIHVDGVQAFGKIPVNLKELKADYYAISGHKIRGPRGVGGLFIHRNVNPVPLIRGGGQEESLRSGTENTPGILGFLEAAEIRVGELDTNLSTTFEKRRQLIRLMKDRVQDVHIIEALEEENQTPGILMLSLEGTKSEVLLRMLSDDGIYLSAGSACSSKKTAASHVLRAMKISQPLIDGALRVSFDESLSLEEIDRFVHRLTTHVQAMRMMMKR